jgi:hypothetical protein
MKYIITLLFITIQLITIGQIRYLDSNFVAEKTDSAIVYGQAEAINAPYLLESWTSTQDLLLDVYQPQNDTETNRPCIIFAHGGAFLIGSREDATGVNVCNNMSKKGYVVVSVDYRMGYNTLSGNAAERAVYRGVQDMKAAIRYVKENANTFGIDTNLIFAMGNSAGSIMSIHAAYFDEAERASIQSTFNNPDLGCLKCSGNLFNHNDEPVAISNLWGAILDTNYIESGDAPMISFHGTDDFIVSADQASPFNSPFFPALSGSNLLTPRLENLDIETAYWKFYGQGHEPWGVFSETPYFDTIIDQTTIFFYDFLLNYTSTNTLETIDFETSIYPNPTIDKLNISINSETTNKFNLLIINNLGQKVITKNVFINQGTNQIEVIVNHLPKGNYYLIINNGEQTISKIFVKH